jgi:hypothetical protein
MLWIALDVAFIPTYGIVGLAVASVAAVWLALVLGVADGRYHPWISVWPGVIISRETGAIVIASVISVIVGSELIRRWGIEFGLAILPLLVAIHLAICAAGGSRLARQIGHTAIRSARLR